MKICNRDKQLQNKPPILFTAEKDKVLSRVAKFKDVVSTVMCYFLQAKMSKMCLHSDSFMIINNYAFGFGLSTEVTLGSGKM